MIRYINASQLGYIYCFNTHPRQICKTLKIYLMSSSQKSILQKWPLMEKILAAWPNIIVLKVRVLRCIFI